MSFGIGFDVSYKAHKFSKAGSGTYCKWKGATTPARRQCFLSFILTLNTCNPGNWIPNKEQSCSVRKINQAYIQSANFCWVPREPNSLGVRSYNDSVMNLQAACLY